MRETLNKFGETSDKIISSIPLPAYIFVGVFLLMFIGQGVYQYATQEQPINFSINTDFLNDADYVTNNIGGIMEQQIDLPLYQGPVRPGDDEDYFRLTGITKPKESNN